MDQGCIMQIADFSAAFASNFVSSLLRLQGAVRDQLGLETFYVLPTSARARPWIAALETTGAAVGFIDKSGSHRERVQHLVRMAKDRHAALLHTHFGTFDVDAAYAGSRLRRPVVWHMHSPFLTAGSWRRQIGERLKFALVARICVDRIIAVSPSVANGAIAGGAPRSKFEVVLNGIDVDRVSRHDALARSVLRTRHGISDADTVFLLLGWEPARKGVDLLGDAVQSLHDVVQDALRCLVVSGESNRAEVARLVGPAPEVQVIPPVSNIAELYGAADCFVSASRAEGLPYAIGEAMASGLPIITSDLSQVMSVYATAGEGVLAFPSGDAKALARAMARLMSLSPQDRARIGAANALFVRDHLSLHAWTETMMGVYRSVLGPSRG